MEFLTETLDPESLNILNAEKITDISLQDLDNNDIIEMGITQKGPQKLILKAINILNSKNESSGIEPPQDDQTDQHQTTVDEIKTILRAARNFEQVFHDLIYGKVPNVKKLRQMNSILNNHYFKERILNKDYPSLSEKQQLAENILKSFPQLEKTKASPDDPIESFFFGKMEAKKGPHTGIIEWKIGNLRGKVEKNNRKFLRPPKVCQIPEHLMDDAELIAALRPNNQHMKQICDGMAKCHPHFAFLVQQGKSLSDIATVFPHIVSYNGLVVLQMFEQTYPQHNVNSNMKKFLLSCLSHNTGFSDIADRELRSAIRLMKKMSNCGVKRTISGDKSISASMAEPLMRWTSPSETTANKDVVEGCIPTWIHTRSASQRSCSVDRIT
ncbi:LOW QUALITY PROTEIN: uncharacterized protein LOC6046742 [Culex quinquefasciatus]|uniref:LOW QUALITY PROTEIN: uncharacterized protein LOC6046742 n=1 Tax=Culex quinquefasciatus TaxID=7176 RepID=UPI0018E31FE1|nr:LOW QUALITY PROTEIN: uncharacterized protein LOC6046742 [Culex quinquefasciatus]